jgi:hypothetical protein
MNAPAAPTASDDARAAAAGLAGVAVCTPLVLSPAAPKRAAAPRLGAQSAR